MAAARVTAAKALTMVDDALADGPFLAGAHDSLADLACQPYLAIAEWTGNADLLQAPRVHAWWARLRERPAWTGLRRGA